MRKLFVGSISFFFLVFMGLVIASVTIVEQGSVSITVKNGKHVWQEYGCTECHTLFGNGGYSAPDLTVVYQTRGKRWLSNFFANPPLMRPGRTKRHLSLSKAENEDILKFLAFVAQQDRLGWPPKEKAGRRKQHRD